MVRKNNFIPRRTFGRRFAIADINGCIATLEALLFQKLRITRNDQLFFLGNYIDKGPDSRGVLDLMLHLRDIGYHLYPIRGIREERLLHISHNDTETLNWYLEANQMESLLENEGLAKKYQDFLHGMAYYYETDNAFLVHAGFNFQSPRPFQDKLAMLNTRQTLPDERLPKGKKIFHAHSKRSIEQIQDSLNAEATVIGIHNACLDAQQPDTDRLAYGSLCAVDLDTLQLISQANQDYPTVVAPFAWLPALHDC